MCADPENVLVNLNYVAEILEGPSFSATAWKPDFALGCKVLPCFCYVSLTTIICVYWVCKSSLYINV